MHTTSIIPGAVWLNTNGKPIQAHGGGILRHGDRWYWYGEDKGAATERDGGCGFRVPALGVRCYSSIDLLAWQDEGTVLAPSADENHDLHPSRVVERPKVLYCAATGRFVMWLHLDTADYRYAAAGVAVADSPTGPFHLVCGIRPHGHDSRDLTVFQDPQGVAWLIHSSEWNATLHVTRLRPDFLSVEPEFTRIFPGCYREAPAVVHHHGRYHLFTSGCSGWDPNPCQHAVADQMEGPWEIVGDPCVGADAAITFHAQSTSILTLPDGQTVFLGDRWLKENLGDSRYIWLPIAWEGDRARISWKDAWKLEVKTTSP